MKLFKKTMVTLLALTMSATMVACGPKKKTSTKNDTQKIEYITEITKDNVEEVVIEYKEILSYYNELKNNLKTIDDVSKNPDLERDAVSAKDSIKNGKTLLKNTQTLYKPLVEAKSLLLKMYDISLELADTVVTDPNTYQEKLKEYDKLFNKFKDMMDKIRSDIKEVRGKAPTDDKNAPKDDKESSDKDKDNKNDRDNSDINSLDDEKNSNKKNDSSSSDKGNNSGNSDRDNNSGNSSSSSSSGNSGGSSSSSGSNSSSGGSSGGSGGSSSSSGNDEFVPSVSSLNNNLRSEIRSAGYNSGASYKQSGGNASNLDQVAAQMFNDLEGDNPIQSNQISEARAIFVSAFKQAYNSK